MKNSIMTRVWEKLTSILWMLSIVTLPVTSFPIVARLTGSSSVAPASLLFLIPLACLTLPTLFFRRKPLPFQVKPVLCFFLFALLSISLAFFRNIPDYKDQKILSTAIEGVATLGLGLLFYLVFVSFPNTAKKIDLTLRILNWSGLLMFIWSIMQGLISPDIKPIYNVIGKTQDFMSITDLFPGRMTGFAGEPSWLAHMLNLVYLVYWLAATISRTSVHRFRIWRFSFENLLLVAGIIVLIGTLSRGGLAAFMLVVALLFVLLNVRLVRWLTKKLNIPKRSLRVTLISVGLIIVYLILLVAGLFLLSKFDPRMENVFQFDRTEENPIIQYAEGLQFGERVVYWQTGWNIFNAHPFLGVGVGFSGFYFPQYLPDAGWGLTETKKLMYHSPGLMNVKNMWSRLLAETGIIGFSLFIAMLMVTFFTAMDLIRSKYQMRRTLGYMGIFMLVAMILEQFSVDSFTLPYVWFTLGLVAAGWRWYLPEDGVLNG